MIFGKSAEVVEMENQQTILEKKGQQLYARSCSDVILQPYSEAITKCFATGLESKEYLVEQFGKNDSMTIATPTVIFPQMIRGRKEEAFLRFINRSNQTDAIGRGTYSA